jgi:hypothetical protein
VLPRRGNHASAKFWRRVLLPVIERYRDRDIPKYFRGDSAFALPKLLRLLEKEGFRYAILPSSSEMNPQAAFGPDHGLLKATWYVLGSHRPAQAACLAPAPMGRLPAAAFIWGKVVAIIRSSR